MSDESPIDLRGLAVDEPEVMRASIHRFRRRAVILAAWIAVFAAASFAIARRVLLEASRRGLFERRPELDPETPAQEIDHEGRMDLQAAFARLEPLDRETLMLVDFLGFTPAEAAEITGIESGAFRMRVHRARHRLRDLLEES